MNATPPNRAGPRRRNRQRVEHRLAVLAVASVVLAWFIGDRLQRSSLETALPLVLPAATRFDPIGVNTFAAHDPDRQLGFVAFGVADGYGGPLELATAVNQAGVIVAVHVAGHKETPSFMDHVLDTDLTDRLVGRRCDATFELGVDIDGVTGATYTARAIVDAAAEAARSVATSQLGVTVPESKPPPVRLGIPEWVLLALYAAWFVGHRKGFRYKRQLRWGMLITGMVVLGFLYNVPLTISRINLFLAGFWPMWQTDLYWYLLIGGLLLVAAADGKNAYCSWFCPFGALQECLAAIGGTKTVGLRRYRERFRWVQRGLAWAAIVLALLFRNPGISSYEVFGTMFSLTGSAMLFALLGLILVMALFVRRPWCNYLCPMDPIYDLIRLTRNEVRKRWKRTASHDGLPT